MELNQALTHVAKDNVLNPSNIKNIVPPQAASTESQKFVSDFLAITKTYKEGLTKENNATWNGVELLLDNNQKVKLSGKIGKSMANHVINLQAMQQAKHSNDVNKRYSESRKLLMMLMGHEVVPPKASLEIKQSQGKLNSKIEGFIDAVLAIAWYISTTKEGIEKHPSAAGYTMRAKQYYESQGKALPANALDNAIPLSIKDWVEIARKGGWAKSKATTQSTDAQGIEIPESNGIQIEDVPLPVVREDVQTLPVYEDGLALFQGFAAFDTDERTELLAEMLTWNNDDLANVREMMLFLRRFVERYKKVTGNAGLPEREGEE